MKNIAIFLLLLTSTATLAGTLTIVPDSTSTMGLEKQRREAIEKERAARQARIAAGIEQPPPVIIIKQAPRYVEPPRQSLECRDRGFGRITCD